MEKLIFHDEIMESAKEGMERNTNICHINIGYTPIRFMLVDKNSTKLVRAILYQNLSKITVRSKQGRLSYIRLYTQVSRGIAPIGFKF